MYIYSAVQDVRILPNKKTARRLSIARSVIKSDK